jgi:hypothetical protein
MRNRRRKVLVVSSRAMSISVSERLAVVGVTSLATGRMPACPGFPADDLRGQKEAQPILSPSSHSLDWHRSCRQVSRGNGGTQNKRNEPFIPFGPFGLLRPRRGDNFERILPQLCLLLCSSSRGAGTAGPEGGIVIPTDESGIKDDGDDDGGCREWCVSCYIM